MLYVNPLETNLALAGTIPEPGARRAETLKEFERLFLFQLLREMRKSVKEGGLFAENRQREYFEEMLDDHLAGAMAESGQFGIAAAMEAQLEQQDTARVEAPAAWKAGLALEREGDALRIRDGQQYLDVNATAAAMRVAPYRPIFHEMVRNAG